MMMQYCDDDDIDLILLFFHGVYNVIPGNDKN